MRCDEQDESIGKPKLVNLESLWILSNTYKPDLLSQIKKRNGTSKSISVEVDELNKLGKKDDAKSLAARKPKPHTFSAAAGILEMNATARHVIANIRAGIFHVSDTDGE